MDMVDAILERPKGFSLGRKRFALYPASLGKKLMVARLFSIIKFDDKVLESNPYHEALRVVSIYGETISRIIVLYTLNSKEEHFDEVLIGKRMDYFRRKADNKSLASLLCLILTDNDIERFKNYIGLEEDMKKKSEVLSVKKSSNTMVFGGKSIYGTLIDTACQRYGWTLDYVVWGISYTNLKMLLADNVTDVFLTDEESKNLNKSKGVIDADDLRNMNDILAMKWD